MRIVEIANYVLDELSKTTIFEMARDRRDVIEKVRGMTDPIIDHLIYLYLYPNSINKTHWFNELNTFLEKIDRLYLKPSGKRKLTGNDYYQFLFREPLEGDIQQLKTILKHIIRKEGTPEEIINYSELLEYLEKTIHKLSYDLSTNNFNNIRNYVS